MKPLRNRLYQKLIKPAARTEDDQRRAYIFNILIIGTIALSSLSLLSSAVSKLTRGSDYDTVPLVIMAGITGFFISLWYLSKRGYYRSSALIYVVTFFLIATYPIIRWGIALPQGILTYCLIIVVAGVLLNARAAFVMTGLITGTLLVIEWLNTINDLHFDTAWMKTTGGYNDVIVYGITFSIVALVSWLSNRQIDQSLKRARQSEKDLRIERDLLEVRVIERTKELERAHIDQLEELNRFAEFGRISSTLLHELANPLTAAVLNLGLIKSKRTSKIYNQLHESISYMEEYVSSARRQLRRESDIGEFDIATEIKRVVDFLQPKARSMHLVINMSLESTTTLNGDSVKFNQIMSNLLVNAIDAYETLLISSVQSIDVTSKLVGKSILVTVADSGIGIPRKAITHIFEPFYTTKSLARGTGLGLTITKRTIEEDFGGRLDVTSSKRNGTQFSILIALDKQ